MDEYILPTIVFDASFQSYRLSDGSVVNVRIMDTGGQERYDSIIESYYKDADCCLLVYDITCEKSFEKVENYYVKKLNEYCKSILKVILLGNKTDLEEKRQISLEQGLTVAEKNGYIFMETSCKTNYNVADAFTTLIEMTNTELIRKHRINNKDNNNITVNLEDNKTKGQKKKNCC